MNDLASRVVPLDDLALFHRNPRKGDVNAIAESLSVNGQYRLVVVNAGTLTGRPLEVLAGNHTVQAARKIGMTEIAVSVIDVDEETAARIVAADNRLGDLGGYDLAALVHLLDGLEDLAGTGYTADDLDDLRDDAELPELLKATTDFGEGDKKKAGGNLMFRTAWTRVPEVQLELFVAALDDYEREHGDSTGFVRMLCEKRLP